MRFFERFEEFYIHLIINSLYSSKNFRLFILSKNPLEVLNLHFGRKYHFVKLKKSILACFLAEAFDRGISRRQPLKST